MPAIPVLFPPIMLEGLRELKASLTLKGRAGWQRAESSAATQCALLLGEQASCEAAQPYGRHLKNHSERHSGQKVVLVPSVCQKGSGRCSFYSWSCDGVLWIMFSCFCIRMKGNN